MTNSTIDDSYVAFQELVLNSGVEYITTVPRISACISVFSSLLIVYLLLRSFTGLRSIYHRIMFGMSIGDIISSTAIAFGHMAMPRAGLSQAVDFMFPYCPQERLGNTLTCDVQGFFYFTGYVISSLYGGSLCWYYFFVIVRMMDDKMIRRKVEPFLHFIPVVTGLIMGSVFVSISGMNPAISWCAPVPLPLSCIQVGKCESERLSLETYENLMLPMYIVLSAIVLVSIIFCLMSVYLKLLSLRWSNSATVNDQETDRRQHQSSNIHRVSRGTNHVSTIVSPINDLRECHEIDLRASALQALAYVVAYFSSIGISFFWMAIDHESSTFTRIQLALQPLQGLLNFLIFTFWKILQHKSLNPTMTYSATIRHIFCEQSSDPIVISRSDVLQESKTRNEEKQRRCDDASLGHLNNKSDVISSGVSVHGHSLASPADVLSNNLEISFDSTNRSKHESPSGSFGSRLRLSDGDVISDASTLKN